MKSHVLLAACFGLLMSTAVLGHDQPEREGDKKADKAKINYTGRPEEEGVKFEFPRSLLDGVSLGEFKDAESTQYFFTCTEHPDYPLGKPFGPFDSEHLCDLAMARHNRATGHTDMAVWTGPGRFAPAAREKARESARCFCVGDCVKGTGDSSHFRKTADVPCDMSDQDKKKTLMRAMTQHYLQAGHITDLSDLDAVFRDMQQNIKIRCYEVNTFRAVKGADLAKRREVTAELAKDDSKTSAAREARSRLQVYAGPNVFGPWAVVASHIGQVRYTIAVEPIGDTTVVGEVRYYDERNNLVTKGFYQQVSITTGNSVANVEVHLKGIPFGSSCWVDVN